MNPKQKKGKENHITVHYTKLLKTTDQVKNKLKVSHEEGREQRYEWQQTFCQGVHKPEHNGITFLKNW